MLRRSPLKAKRATPRRNEGRVNHGRVKPKGYTPFEEWHVARLRTLQCCVTGCARGSIAHHVMKVPAGFTKRTRRDHRYAVNICNEHHNLQDDSVHLLGSEEKFLQRHGIDLFREAVLQWNNSIYLYKEAP